jgi:hypothetical protein
VRRIAPDFIKGGGGIDIPEHRQGIVPGLAQDALKKLRIIDPDAARLDDHIGVPRLCQNGRQTSGRGRPDHHPRPFGRIDVTVGLPVIDVGLVEGDLVAARGERPQDPAVIGRCAVPVGRQQARSVKGDLHALSCEGA